VTINAPDAANDKVLGAARSCCHRVRQRAEVVTPSGALIATDGAT
jgi:hypothetical protein